jgi:hypothetical protein
MRISSCFPLIVLLSLTDKVWAQAPSESSVKVAYIYNFLKYVRRRPALLYRCGRLRLRI